jgi:hypothetical protein
MTTSLNTPMGIMMMKMMMKMSLVVIKDSQAPNVALFSRLMTRMVALKDLLSPLH